MATTLRDYEASTKSNDLAQLKGWRFPLSRYHLWDRHAIGERIEASALVVPIQTMSCLIFCVALSSRDNDLIEGDRGTATDGRCSGVV